MLELIFDVSKSPEVAQLMQKLKKINLENDLKWQDIALWTEYKQELARIFESSLYSEVHSVITLEFNLLVKEFKVKASIKIPKIVGD